MQVEPDNSSQQEQEMIMFNNEQDQVPPEQAFPWYNHHTRKLTDPLLRFHNQAIDFFLYVIPSHNKSTAALVERYIKVACSLKKEINDVHPDVEILSPFYDHRLYLKGTEVELYLLLPDFSPVKIAQIHSLLKGLSNNHCIEIESSPSSFPSSPSLSSPQKYQTTEFQLTISNHPLILRLLDHTTYHDYFIDIETTLTTSPDLPYFYMILTTMIRQRWMHMSIRPLLLFGLLMIFNHERRKQKQRQRTLGEGIIKFLQIFGVGHYQQKRFNYLGRGSGFEMFQDGYGSGFSLWVKGSNIVSIGLRDLFAVFRNRYRLVANYNFDEEQSIVGALVNPCSKEFDY